MDGYRAGASGRGLGPRAFILRPGVVAGLAAAALDGGWILDVRGDGFSARDWFVAVVLALAAVAGIAGTAVEIPRVRGVALAWASGSLLSVGALSLSSIGLPLLAAGGVAAAAMLATVGYAAPRRTIVAVGIALLVSFAVVYAGVALTR